MDRTEVIAISKIATLICEEKIIRTDDNSVWDKILSNAGQSELYERYEENLQPYTYNGKYQNPNRRFNEFFTAIKTILKTVYLESEDSGEFQKLIEAIVDAIDFNLILEGDHEELEEGNYYYNFKQYMERVDDRLARIAMETMAVPAYKELVLNLNILNLDIQFENRKLKLRPLTEDVEHANQTTSVIMDWLKRDHSAIADVYKEALESYSNGQPVSCIASCRIIMTGLFSESKDEQTKWANGLLNVSTDQNIQNVTAKDIIDNKANRNFNYPRFRSIYSLYVMTCDLGAHNLEGPIVDGSVQREVATMNDALLCLRMTQDVLLWVKATKQR